jgi:hypothetical protein
MNTQRTVSRAVVLGALSLFVLALVPGQAQAGTPVPQPPARIQQQAPTVRQAPRPPGIVPPNVPVRPPRIGTMPPPVPKPGDIDPLLPSSKGPGPAPPGALLPAVQALQPPSPSAAGYTGVEGEAKPMPGASTPPAFLPETAAQGQAGLGQETTFQGHGQGQGPQSPPQPPPQQGGQGQLALGQGTTFQGQGQGDQPPQTPPQPPPPQPPQ